MALTRWIFVLLFAAGATALSAQNVTTNADSGTGSLRDAITQANTNPGDDTITFGISGTITLLTALPVITGNLTIDGPGRTALTIERDSAAAEFRIFETSVIGVELHINELTIAGGRAVQGGGIFSRGPTSLWDVRITNCIAQGATGGSAQGGAIYHSPAIAALLITNSLIENCQAIGGDNAAGNGGDGDGGAIFFNAGTLAMLSSTIDNCDAIGGSSTGANGNGGYGRGGGIYASFAATLTDCVVSNCTAVGGASTGTGTGLGGQGGGIIGSGTITSIDTTWQGNAASSEEIAEGGAIAFAPSGTQQLTVTRSVLNGNSVTSTNNGAIGAAIVSTGIVEIRETTISASVATVSGSFNANTIHHPSASTFLMERTTISGNNGRVTMTIAGSTSATFVNSTISGNTGGALWGQTASISITFCTITLNNGLDTGGIVLTSGVATMIGSILAGNTGPTPADVDFLILGGTLADGGGNVVGVDDAANFTSVDTQAGTSGTPLDPMLGALTDNGGLTFTHALLSGSPAIDEGGSTAVPSTDQRNATRNVGPADAGAYEFGATVPSGQGKAGGEGDERCSVSPGAGLPWLLVLGLIAALGVRLRTRRA